MKNIKVLLTGGGTSGHVLPVISVSKKLQQKNCSFFYVGSKKGIEEEIAKKEQIKYFPIETGKLRRYFSFQNFVDPFKIIIGFFQSIMIIKKQKPNVVFAKGGYVTIPVVLAAFFARVPIILHESDSVMGLSNRFLLRFAKKVAVSFPLDFYSKKISKKIIYTGLPLRFDFEKKTDCDLENFKLSKTKKTILITGGSQGAEFINQIIFQILPNLIKKHQIIHITGEFNFKKAQEEKLKLKNNSENYKCFKYLHKDMLCALKLADLIITRAGANTLFEIAYLKKPSIIIPLPGAASDHQNKNADFFQQQKAALILRQNDFSASELENKIENLLSSPYLLKNFSKQLDNINLPLAADKIAELIIYYSKK